MKTEIYTYRIRVIGLVQGVGFRPFIYKLAKSLNLKGTVDNRNDGVIIFVNISLNELDVFVKEIKLQAPKAACIDNIEVSTYEFIDFTNFKIIKSDNNEITDQITEVSPDIAVCDNCLEDIKTQSHRLQYPLTNCTHCGPRFSIIKSLPYDRPNTTMAEFVLCPSCQKEYTDVNDRRFHAQPVSCNECGPIYSLENDKLITTEIESILSNASKSLISGQTIVMKGIGGYNLICDAKNENAVALLRLSKHRDGKPLAVMFKDIATLKKYAVLSEIEVSELESWRRPILLVKQIKSLAAGVNVGFSRVGAMLSYLPFHYMLFDACGLDAIVVSSANLAGEPIMIDDDFAKSSFIDKNISIISYNREIYNRVDDTVSVVINNIPRLIRRSRGHVPSPIRLHTNVDGIIALGAELVNTFCIGRTNQAILSQHIGDLKNAETFEFYQESINRFSQLYKFDAKVIACDMHPDYMSTNYANSRNLPIIKVQHHHAHMASCMMENKLDEKVLGVILDGTGLGTDGKIWGGEFFIGDLYDFDRFAHFDEIALPGGDKVTEQPWRTALSYLYSVYGQGVANIDIPFINNIKSQDLKFIIQIIDKNINSPKSTSAGRLFDAVAALIGVCNVSNFHAEAPMRLEDILPYNNNSSECYSYENINNVISFKKMFVSIVNDIIEGIENQVISLRFHNTIVNVCADICVKMRAQSHINKVVLSGGSFQNEFLSEKLENMLASNGFEVFVHNKVPANDGGISLGQLGVASRRLLID